MEHDAVECGGDSCFVPWCRCSCHKDVTRYFEEGEEVFLAIGSHHAPRSSLNPYQPDDRVRLKEGRGAVFVRYMAGGEYAIVHAARWGSVIPARDLRVLVADIKKIRSA